MVRWRFDPMEWLINPKLADEIELDRPASGWPERIFRFSVRYFLVVGMVGAILEFVVPKKKLEAAMGALGLVLGTGFLVCTLYMFNYGAYRFVRTRWVRWAGFGLEGVVVLLLLNLLFTKLVR
jgi:hypothetical protein